MHLYIIILYVYIYILWKQKDAPMISSNFSLVAAL